MVTSLRIPSKNILRNRQKMKRINILRIKPNKEEDKLPVHKKYNKAINARGE